MKVSKAYHKTLKLRACNRQFMAGLRRNSSFTVSSFFRIVLTEVVLFRGTLIRFAFRRCKIAYAAMAVSRSVTGPRAPASDETGQPRPR